MVNQDSMAFLQTLSREVLRKEVSLPSFPDVVIQIRDAMASEDCDIRRVTELASMESVLASRLVATANSALYNAGANKITDLHTAVMRMGLKEVRNMAIALAAEQLFESGQHSAIAEDLSVLWRRSIRMSSIAETLAKHCTKTVSPDQAFLCGLLHDIGKLYIVTKAQEFPGVAVDLDARSDAPDVWHPQVGHCIVEAWGFDDAIVETLQPSEVMRDDPGLAPNLVDVVFAAELVTSVSDDAPLDTDVPAVKRLGLDAERLAALAPHIQSRMDSMSQLLAR